MATVHLKLRDDLEQRLAERAAENGYKTPDEYVEALVVADLENDDIDQDPEVEELLLRRLDNGPAVELTPEFEKQFLAELAQRDNSAKR